MWGTTLGHAGSATATSYAYLSTACRAQWTAAAWADQMQVFVAMIKGVRHLDPARTKAGTVTIDEYAPPTARVAVEWLGPDGQPINTGHGTYRYEDGGWHATECPSLTDELGTTTTVRH